MLKKGNSRAQSITEYVLLVGLVALILISMQTYMKRGIQGVVKTAADEVGNQREGGLEYDYRREWKVKGATEIKDISVAGERINKAEQGVVSYDAGKSSRRLGILSWGWWTKEGD